jgi:hypothetical protein
MGLVYFISFHCIRLFYCGLCNYDGFKVVYDKKNKLNKILIKYGYISILCTFVPLIIGQIIILSLLNVGKWLWMFGLDSLILTTLLAILILIDLRNIEKELLRHELEKVLGPSIHVEGEQLMNSSNSVKGLIEMFPQLDFSNLVPPQPVIVDRKPRVKWISKSGPNTRVSSPVVSKLNRRGSFPIMANENIELKPESLVEKGPPDIIDEPYGEEILEKDDHLSDDLTILQDETSILQENLKEFEISITEYKDPIVRPTNLVYTGIDIEANTEEYTEVIAYTEEEEEEVPNEKEIIQNTETKEIEEFTIENQVHHSQSSLKNLLETENIVETPQNNDIVDEIPSQEEIVLESNDKSSEPEGNNELGTIKEENDLELEKAVPDTKDPELVTVFSKERNQRVRIRKGFKGARIVDLENKIIDSLAPIDTSKYEVNKTIVDDNDVRYATMTANTGEKVRVKRSFKGARILDLEKKVTNPHSYLIGQSIKNESDFQFSNAYPDPDDPEVVVVMHNETGEDVKVRKTFHGAQIVDEAGDPIVDAPNIDRNDYDIPKTIVDKEDVHLATLKHKITQAKVKVRRNFRGAKIIDLEKKVEFPLKGLNSMLSEKSEPEPLSAEFSQQELYGTDMGWVKPSYPKEVPFKKPPLKPIAITPKNEGYDRKKLANLANLIDDLQEESKDWQQPEPYKFVSDSSDDDKSISSIRPGRKSLYHNVDLDRVYAPDFRQDINEPEEFPVFERKKNKKKKKKVKKNPPVDSQRMRGLEDIYLQRLENKKKSEKPTPMKYTDANFFEPEWERTDSAFDHKPIGTERPLSSAGEEIISSRFRMGTPKRNI